MDLLNLAAVYLYVAGPDYVMPRKMNMSGHDELHTLGANEDVWHVESIVLMSVDCRKCDRAQMLILYCVHSWRDNKCRRKMENVKSKANYAL